MTEHLLKTLAPYWDAIDRGEKNFEVRRDDRGFQKGDVLVLRKLCPDGYKIEWSDFRNDFHNSGYFDIRKRITFILTGGQFGIMPGYVVLALEDDAPITPIQPELHNE